MSQTPIKFQGSQGELSGLLEQQDSQSKAFVLFAHCFTCGKNSIAASHISKALVSAGFAVFRFDFTGLGSSDGDFANTNFSSNVEDLVAAANYLKENHQAPSILIGHSLGGAAVLKAAAQVPAAKAVVTIGSPADAGHVKHLFQGDLDTIGADGEAEVNLGGRPFKIKKQFIDDLDAQNTAHISNLKKALLVMHSPIDDTVSINEAEKIYVAAKHPKSFISLDNANHLLTNKADAAYAAKVIATWSEKFIATESSDSIQRVDVPAGQIRVTEINHKFQCDIQSTTHQWIADEPLKVGGSDHGPDPYQHLLAGLGACTVMTLRMYANLKKIPMDNVIVNLSHNREHGDDCQSCTEEHPKVDVIERSIEFKGELTKEQINKLLVIADKCPVHRTLHNKIEVRTELKN
ncbi:bifunctional alpha/beta hydrolase/OsmC family protein [Marinicella marina]|uniref:bifunctional alpha/beta hydrolase/OsmC family protein n=1 Tax=Marinicella marina TaxID=2996016 RepID=UPI0024BCA71F|nr:bifunctional alpha/beta hydrolase/OsmC family protein [Marinicella marina]MDJ1139474.1 bifunctional alpha/beta hydrolase/OsmC family protein [Marinicella marina]